jgi:hypothetical protein
MAKANKTEYGVLIAPIGTVDSDTSMTKKSFFARLETEYPSTEGWEVIERSVTPNGTTVIMAYHVQKVNA